MKVVLLGAASFIGTNLAIKLSESGKDEITLVDINKSFFGIIKNLNLRNIRYKESSFDNNTNFDSLLSGQDIIYHLISTTVPTTSNQKISEELMANVVTTSKMLDACVRVGIKKIIFISSGGTVYGKEVNCPLKENIDTNPINSYGIQKVTIEKLLYLYQYMYGLDYRVVRLANPYGPYQRPNGILGAVTTFTYKALKKKEIVVYGDGSVIRDFIYIDDAIKGILNIANGVSRHKIFNLGCGYGTSIKQVLETVELVIGNKVDIIYKDERKIDVPVNYLDISRYETAYGKLNPINLIEGIKKTAEFMKIHYNI